MNYEINNNINHSNFKNTVLYFKNELSEIQSRNEYEIVEPKSPNGE